MVLPAFGCKSESKRKAEKDVLNPEDSDDAKGDVVFESPDLTSKQFLKKITDKELDSVKETVNKVLPTDRNTTYALTSDVKTEDSDSQDSKVG